MTGHGSISPELREYLTSKEMEKLMRAPNPRIDLTKRKVRHHGSAISIRAEHATSSAYEPMQTLDGLGDEGFMAFVFEEALDRVASQEAQLLRAADVAERWHWSLGQLMAKVNARLSEMVGRQHNGGQEYWRSRQLALFHKAALQERRTEIAPLAKRMKRQRHEARESERSNSQEQKLREALENILRIVDSESPLKLQRIHAVATKELGGTDHPIEAEECCIGGTDSESDDKGGWAR